MSTRTKINSKTRSTIKSSPCADPIVSKDNPNDVNKSEQKSKPKKLIISSLIILIVAIVINLIISHLYVDNGYPNDLIISESGKSSNDGVIIKSEEGKVITSPEENNNNVIITLMESNSTNNQEETINSEKVKGEEEKIVYSFLATVEQDIQQLSLYQQPCSPTGYRYEDSIGSAPETCGVTFTDYLVDDETINRLQLIADNYTELFGETTTTNRESYNLQWINLHSIFRKPHGKGLISDDDYQLLLNVSQAAKAVVSMAFGVPEDRLYFTTVCQFTRYEPVTTFSEFRHIDKVRSPELIVTSILWLSTVDEHFSGGRLEFLNGPGEEQFNPILIEPKKGRYAAWTSSHENPHGVHELFHGKRLALIFAFTANPKFGHSTIEQLRTWATIKKPSFYY